MLKKLGLLDTPEDAFANGFMLGCLGMIAIWVTTVILIINYLDNSGTLIKVITP